MSGDPPTTHSAGTALDFPLVNVKRAQQRRMTNPGRVRPRPSKPKGAP